MHSLSQVRSPHWNQYMASLLLTMGSLSFGETSRFLMVLLPLKWVCIIPPTDLFDTFTKTLGVWYHKVTLGFDFIGYRLGTCRALAVSPIIDLPGRPVKSFLHLVQRPFGIFTIGESLPDMTHFFLEKLRIATHSFNPMGKGTMILYFAER